MSEIKIGLIILAMLILAGCSFEKECTENVLVEHDKLLNDYQQISRIAMSTGRISLSPLLMEMNSISSNYESLLKNYTVECGDKLLYNLTTNTYLYMIMSNEAYLSFMGDEGMEEFYFEMALYGLNKSKNTRESFDIK